MHSDAEITPPLYFVAPWLTTQLGLTPELLRAPSLLAGVATIPLIYLVGLRTVGRPAALVAATLTTLSPFMIFYSAEARGYALAMALVLLSTLALLAAVDDGRARWWVVYAAATWGAMYTHYTVVFVLVAQLLLAALGHPRGAPGGAAGQRRRGGRLPALAHRVGADLESPTTDILSALAPFTADTVSDRARPLGGGLSVPATRDRAARPARAGGARADRGSA